jgi:bacteriochlorophyll 4-vinyl reductase
MRDAGIGRVLVAALHQSIADVLPDRLEFYENWLHAKGLRDGTIGLAALAAVLSFLRTEGAAYERVTTRAGEYAAEWTVNELSPFGRRLIAAAPPFLRRKLALRVARGLVHRSYTGSRATIRVRRGIGAVDIKSSIFCGVRDRTTQPLCYFYAAAVERVLQRLDITAATTVTACQAEGAPACHLEVKMGAAAAPSTGSVDAEGAPAA